MGSHHKIARSIASPDWLVRPLNFVVENGLARQAEQPRDTHAQWQRRIGLAILNGVDTLARDIEPCRQIGLSPAFFGAQDAQAVFHAFEPRGSFPSRFNAKYPTA